MAQIKRVSDNLLITVQANPTWLAGIWECGDQRFVDQAQTLYVVGSLNLVPSTTFPLTKDVLASQAKKAAAAGNQKLVNKLLAQISSL